MRVSGYEKFQMTQGYLNKLQYDSTKLHEQIATGKSYQRVSDDPIKVNKSMLIDSSLMRVDQYLKNTADSQSLLSFVDTIYSNTIDAIHIAKEAGIKGANETFSAEDRKVMAQEVDQMISQIVAFSNSKYLDRYPFSGEKTDTKSIDFDGTNFTYNGNANEMKIEVSDNLKIKVSQTADEVFIPVLENLKSMRDALNNNDTVALQAGMAQLDDSFSAMIDKRSEMGVQSKTAELLESSFLETKLDLTAKKQETDDVNLADAISEFTYMQTLYQATIKSASNMLKTSVMDYL
jgi:flagellar hook-associated protein 3 FlgL